MAITTKHLEDIQYIENVYVLCPQRMSDDIMLPARSVCILYDLTMLSQIAVLLKLWIYALLISLYK